MSELEDKLNSILSSPEEMEKLLGVARSLSGSLGASKAASDEVQPGMQDFASAASALGDMDPKMFKMMTHLLSEYSSHKSDKTPLLQAMKPYLKEERYSTIDRAAEIAKLAHIAKIAFGEFGLGEKK